MANSILWKDISCEEVGELLLATDIKKCKNKLYDNLSLASLFHSPTDYNKFPENSHREEDTMTTTTSENNVVEEKGKQKRTGFLFRLNNKCYLSVF